MSATEARQPTPPTATIRRDRRFSFAWIVPVLALALAAWLGYASWQQRGLIVTVTFDNGHSLKIGDAVRHRGIAVGEVHDIRLTGRAETVEIDLALRRSAESMARAGTRFWIVRPQVALTGVEGLETLLGPRYVALRPGQGPRRRTFVGLEQPPILQRIDPGDLEVQVAAPQRGSLVAGAPVTYRQVRIGTVLSVGLSSDAGDVEARVHVDKPYVALLRDKTVFWDSGGFEAKVGLTGASLQFDSIETLLRGSLSLATPEDAGSIVSTGHRYELADDPPEDWREWEPSVPIGNELLPSGVAAPEMLRVRLSWREGRLGPFMATDRSRRAWAIPLGGRLLVPGDLVRPPDDAKDGSVRFEVAGEAVPFESTDARSEHLTATLTLTLPSLAGLNETLTTRDAESPEDCLIVAGPGVNAIPVAGARLTASGDRPGFVVDESVPIDHGWHGAAVVARADGAVIGQLIVDEEDESARVAPLPSVD